MEKHQPSWYQRSAFIVIITGLLACNLVTTYTTGIPATQTAISVLQTQLAGTFTAEAPMTAMPVPGETITPASIPIFTPAAPTAALETLAALAPTVPLDPFARQNTPTPETWPADERLLKSARILLFEDMSASRYVRIIKQALDQAGYSYLDVGSAQGWFKTQLLADTEWDLIIAAAEAERAFGGEFYGFLADRLDSGSSIILETWDLDATPNGYARQLLDRCGLRVQADWYLPDQALFYWTDRNHPLFNTPNSLPNGLRSARSVWRSVSGDLGDLIQLAPGLGLDTDARLLATTNTNWTQDHALLSTCLGERMILQTFRTHEYDDDDMTALWQNYIFHALQSHFTHQPRSLATPAVTFAPVEAVQITRPGPTPGPDYTFPHACGGALTARLLRSPIFTPILFEHNAEGTFMVLRLEVVNTGSEPVMIWDGDYSLQSSLYGNQRLSPLHLAATGFLYIESPTYLAQDLVQPGQTWQTALAFDVPAAAKDWVLIVRPGSEFAQTVCEVRIPLTR